MAGDDSTAEAALCAVEEMLAFKAPTSNL